MLDPDSAVSRSERSSGLVTNEVGRNGGAFASYGEEGRKWLGSARVRSRSREAKTRPSAGGRGVHRRERWRARCTPSKAAKAEEVRTAGAPCETNPISCWAALKFRRLPNSQPPAPAFRTLIGRGQHHWVEPTKGHDGKPDIHPFQSPGKRWKQRVTCLTPNYRCFNRCWFVERS
jgi:hypothetical protein